MAEWLTPKLNWLTGDAPTPADFKRIEGNMQYLYDWKNIKINSGSGIITGSVSSESWAKIASTANLLPSPFGGRQVINKLTITLIPPGNVTLDSRFEAYAKIKLPDGSWAQTPIASAFSDYGVHNEEPYVITTSDSKELALNFNSLSGAVEVEIWGRRTQGVGSASATATVAFDAYLA